MKYFFPLLMLLAMSTILQAQNVGIGTTSPSEKLHIADGQIRLSRIAAASNSIIFNMPPTDGLFVESQGLQFRLNNVAKASITHNDSPIGGSILRLSHSSSTANDLVIDESGSVGMGTSNPSGSAILDLSSTSKGVLIPRMSRASRDAISSPSTGLLLYQSNETPGFYYNAGTTVTPNWVNMAKRVDTISIGAEAFFPRSASGNYVTDAHSARYINVDGSTEQLRAVVNFPAGVTVKQMRVFFYDESSSANLRFTLNENYLEQGFVNETVFDYTSSSTSTGVRTATINNNYLIKNNLYSYYINARPAVGSWNFSGDVKIKGVMLVYEY